MLITKNTIRVSALIVPLIFVLNTFAQIPVNKQKFPWGMTFVSSKIIPLDEMKMYKDVPVVDKKYRSVANIDSGSYRLYLYVDDTEIMVSEYLEFFYYSKSIKTPSPSLNYLPEFEEDNKLYEILFQAMKDEKFELIKDWRFSKKLPIPNKYLSKNNKLKSSIFKLMSLPISNISFDQALAYCDWRGQFEKEIRNGYFKFSLPKIEVFELYSTEADSVFKNNNNYWATGNYSFITNTIKNNNRFDEFLSNNNDTICPTGRFRNNQFHLYDTKGNLSEMTVKNGISMGGNYTMTFSQINNNMKQTYSKPEIWLGFRCVAYIIIKEN